MQVHWSKKAAVGSNFGTYGGYAGLEHRDVPTSRRSNVATSPRRDIPTSRRWVNYCASQQAATSRCLNVVTSQRRDVSTSRRLNVATFQRRDVSASSAFPTLKANGGADLGASGGVRPRAQNSRAGVTPTSKKCP